MATAPRLACLLIPLFPLAARLRCEPELTGEAVALFEGNGNAARLVAATRTARRAGLRPGLTLPQARALLPRLVVRPRDGECERSAQEALLDAAETVSPRVEDAGQGVAFADLAGLERRYPGEGFERQVAQALVEAAEAASLPARVAVAGSKLAARVAAETAGEPVVIPPHEEAAFLAPLPLSRLAPQVRVAATLERWGVRSVGELARLPAAEVASRLGEAGSELHTIARGIDPRPLVPRQVPPVFREAMTLEWPLVALEPFLFVGRAACQRLCERLRTQGLAARRVEVALLLEPDGLYERAIELPAPTRDAKTLLTLVRLELEAKPPGAPVTGLRFTAHPDRPREAQLSLFGPAELSPDRLATTLARLFALLGPERVGAPQPVDGHRPERFDLVPYAPPPPPKVRPEPRCGRGLLTVRALRPPVPLRVKTNTLPIDEVAEPTPGAGPPPYLADLRLLAVESPPDEDEEDAGATAVARKGKRAPRIRGRVRVASGPWGLEEEWWSERPVERDYWDVELSDGGIYRIYRDRLTGQWAADGIYD